MDGPKDLETRQSIGHVLRTHPEGQSLFGEAGHYKMLAEQSAVAVTRAFTGMQESRLTYDELRHQLDPRRRRTIHLGLSSTLLVAIFAALVPLDAIELSGAFTTGEQPPHPPQQQPGWAASGGSRRCPGTRDEVG